MSPSAFLQAFLDGSPSRNVRLAAAQGLAPLPPSEMLRLLVHLSSDSDPDIAAQAASTLTGWSEQDILDQVQLPDCSAHVLNYLADISSTAAIQEAIVLNPRCSAQALAALAGKASPSLLETILYNRVRLLENPDILGKMKGNLAAPKRILNLIPEIEIELFGSKKTEYEIGVSSDETASGAALADIEAEAPMADLSLEGLPVDPEEREAALFRKIGLMTASQRIRLALTGTREARAILIRDANRQVARSVLESPKVSDIEVESYAAMRNISDEILRCIGTSKEWLKSYGVVLNLVKNPKTPPMISQRLLFRLRTKDLSLICRDKGVPEAVRKNAQRALTSRASSKSIM